MSNFTKNIKKTRQTEDNSPQKENPDSKQYDLRGMGDDRTPSEFSADYREDVYYVEGTLRDDPRPSETALTPSDIYGPNIKQIVPYLVMALVAFYILKKIISKFK